MLPANPLPPAIEMPVTKNTLRATTPAPTNVTKTTTTTTAATTAVTATTPSPLPRPQSQQVDEVLESLKQQRQKLQFEEKRVPTSTESIPKSLKFKPSTPDLSALILDSMLTVAGVLGCLISVILTTRADLVTWAQSMPALELGAMTYGLFALVSFLYTFVSRVFMGYTAGEWVTDQKVVTQSPTLNFKGLMQLMGRSLTPILTGFVIIPTVSMAFGKDFAGQLSGACLVKEQLS